MFIFYFLIIWKYLDKKHLLCYNINEGDSYVEKNTISNTSNNINNDYTNILIIDAKECPHSKSSISNLLGLQKKTHCYYIRDMIRFIVSGKWFEDNNINESEEIKKITPDLADLADEMFELMYEHDWVWLAAPQIGKDIRLIVVTSRKETKKWPELASETAMINPVITEKSKEMIISKEACLSVPWIEWNTSWRY